MYCAKLTIPKMSDTYKLYVYSAKTPDSINTIAKVRTIQPTLVIDESLAVTKKINNKQCYEIYDSPTKPQYGVTYIGPMQNIIPTTEYETSIGIVKINDYTYMNKLGIKDLEIQYNGTMLYYSVIGVDEENNIITHLSKVNGVLVTSKYKEGTRHLYSCDEYLGKDTDVWNYVSSVEWDELLTIGDVNNPSEFARFGIPMVEKVPMLDVTKIKGDCKPVISRNYMVMEIQNPWQKNNKEFNYRKLKSFKLQNVDGEQYSDFSEPTYQSILPVSIEMMMVLRKTDAANPDTPIEVSESVDEDVDVYNVIRKDGIFYNAKDHRKLGLNKYNIPLGEDVAIFSESSVQDEIKIQVEALSNHVYSYTIYLFDVYQGVSEPVHLVVRT